MYTILLVDDEKRMLDLLDLYLSPRRYHCVKCESGLAAIQYLENNKVDLVLLDIMMPEMDGWETCKRIREFSNVPIIMVTARDQTTDIVQGLKIGADDYITKPFDESELLARIEAVLRHSVGKHSKIEFQGLVWDEDEHKVHYQNEPIFLTPKEFAILGLFLKHPNRVFSREQIIVSLWGYNANTEERTIDSHVKNVREKLRQSGFPIDQFLQTVWGIGYKWEA
ncbi:DNA-binding response regulator, OmpR family, contains REC and winged-helix (wHTH) domain [Parageobacillus thermantarcticus]|uniref:DNA-binding response regulator, OmpR family, contains REC and winged-helix (WHTH) domain n=1 Tax=Parageobacillus thermantarcticus TaxID=186116 RepID=A0A1I0TRW4_9BACL|nr:response regulator transcription factor [Parageobacillus thermantarcticus]SFA54499.1 DNA-binding response regulator, OmpR family, contains REC and winged-helix (wHTH) domain [Parageobacillus thermantarcticus]